MQFKQDGADFKAFTFEWSPASFVPSTAEVEIETTIPQQWNVHLPQSLVLQDVILQELEDVARQRFSRVVCRMPFRLWSNHKSNTAPCCLHRTFLHIWSFVNLLMKSSIFMLRCPAQFEAEESATQVDLTWIVLLVRWGIIKKNTFPLVHISPCAGFNWYVWISGLSTARRALL